MSRLSKALRVIVLFTSIQVATTVRAELHTVTFSNPAGVPTSHNPDTGGILQPTCHNFVEDGVHAEAFWVPNVMTTYFIQHWPTGFRPDGHFHQLPNGYETSHGFATDTSSSTPDVSGIYIQMADGRPFDLVSLQYRLLNMPAGTTFRVGTNYDPMNAANSNFVTFNLTSQTPFTTFNFGNAFLQVNRVFITAFMTTDQQKRVLWDNIVVNAGPPLCTSDASCDDGVACTIDTCNLGNGICSHTPDDEVCDNGLYCDGVESCNATLGCQAGTAIDCADDITCTVDTCNEATQLCEHTTSNALCDDSLYCNGVETCDAELGCQAGTSVVCNDEIECTTDACNEATDACAFTPNNAVCTDGIFCNGTEVCNPATGCEPGPLETCNDGIACTTDTCDTETDSCVHSPVQSLCNDGLFCNGTETCDAVLGCLAGTPVNCNDGVACTTDSCNEVDLSCTHTPNNAACNDGLFCNGSETCDAVNGCQAGTPVDCNDGIACTTDACNEAADSCVFTPVNAVCDDGLYCNGSETCSATLGCQIGMSPCGNQICTESNHTCGANREMWMVFTSSANVPGVGVVETQDIASYNLTSHTWTLVFDGSDVGLTLAIDGIARLDNGSILMSFVDPGIVPGLTGGPDGLLVDDSDVVMFTPTSLGANTAGAFSFYFDASDVGLTVSTEDLDGIELNEAGNLVFTTLGAFSVPGLSGDDKDLVTFNATSLGAVTAGTFSVLLDGTDVELTTSDENIDGFSISSTGSFILSTTGAFSVTGASGPDEDIFEFFPNVLGAASSGAYAPLLDLTTIGIDASEDVQELELVETGTEEEPTECENDADCDDGIECTVDSCNTETGTCSYTLDHGSCDDGLFCNGVEACDAELGCTAGAAAGCDDGIACTTDACDENTDSCMHTPNNATCNDGLFCNGTETCSAVQGCVAGTPVNCADSVACTTDTCNEATDSCVHTPNNGSCSDGVYCNGVEICDAIQGCQAGTAPCAAEMCSEANDSCGTSQELLLAFATATNVPTIGTVENEDIVSYDLNTGVWTMVFDGSDVGLSGFAIDAFTQLADDSILLSFNEPGNVTGLTGGPGGLLVDDSDIIRFVPTSLGATTAGSFSFYFDGSDVSLSSDTEDVDAIIVNASGQLILSTNGSYSVTGASGNGGNLFTFTPTNLGSVTTGTYAVYFDGSDVGLSASAAENLDAATIRASGAILYSTSGDFTVPGLSGTNEDIVQFNPTLLGPTTTGSSVNFLHLTNIGIDASADVVGLQIFE